MKKIKNFIFKSNRWYEGLLEHRRFLFFFFCIGLPFIVSIQFFSREVNMLTLSFLTFMIAIVMCRYMLSIIKNN
jgi:hypothetical protein